MVTNSVITNPVSTTDINNVLGAGSNSIPYLCGNEHNKINFAAKFKPVRSTNVYHKNASWFKGDDGDAGVIIDTLIIPSSSDNPVPYQRWYYNNVIKDNNYWFRLSDFNGYDHKADFPFTTSIPTIYTAGFTCMLRKKLNIGGKRDKMLNISEMAVRSRIDGKMIPISSLYFAILIRETGTSLLYDKWVVSSTKIGDNNAFDTQDILINVPPGKVLADRNYDFYLVLSEVNDYINYNRIFNVNYELNGVSNLGYKVNTRPIVATKSVLEKVEWIGLSPGTGNVAGIRLTFEQYGPDFAINGVPWKIDLWGGPLGYPLTIEFFVTKAKGLYIIEELAQFSLDVSYAGTVNFNIYQYINNQWVKELSGTLPI